MSLEQKKILKYKDYVRKKKENRLIEKGALDSFKGKGES